MMNKKSYLYSIRDRISCESDGEREYDAYRGSFMLLLACWNLYEKKGRKINAAPEVVGYMLNNGVTKEKAKSAINI